MADPVGAQLCRAWIENQGLWFDDARSEHETFGDLTFEHMIKWYSTPRPETAVAASRPLDDVSPDAEVKGQRVTESFVALCVTTARELHASGLIEELFGRPIPVIVHEVEYYDEIARQNVEANGPELASGLVQWISSMYDDR